MKKILLTFAISILLSACTFAQLTPEITSWVINPGTDTGYHGILANVQLVQYSTNYVYITCTCIPSYSIGPWNGNPNTASNQSFVYKITRSPQKNTVYPTAVGLGHIGIWTNGVSIFNVSDAMTYNNQGVWHRNAYFFEGSGFDMCAGHPQQQGEYHHHVSPKCLYDETDSTHHSPIIGYMFDGFPVYGVYAYTDTNGTGPIKRMHPSYQLRNITDRTTLPDGSTATYAGPAINSSYPLGAFIEDYKFIQGSGDLDSNNGRFCITPEYPNGIYGYFVTIDSALNPVYPYTSGSNYYGIVTASDIGPNSGHITISDSTTTYSPYTGIIEPAAAIKYEIYPNPVTEYEIIHFDPASPDNIKGILYNTNGQLLQTINHLQPGISYTLDMKAYPTGVYFLHLETGSQSVKQKIVKVE